MIHWLWLLLIIPVAIFIGVFVAALCGASKMAWLQQAAEIESRSLADTLRKKCLEVDQLKRKMKKMEKEK